MNRYLFMTPTEIMAAAQSPETSAMDLMIASIVSKAVEHGDHFRCEFILRRMLGEPPKTTEDPDDRKPIVLAYRLDDEEIE